VAFLTVKPEVSITAEVKIGDKLNYRCSSSELESPVTDVSWLYKPENSTE